MPRIKAAYFAGAAVALAAIAATITAKVTNAFDRPAGYGAVVDFRRVIAPPPAPASAEATAERARLAGSTTAIGTQRWQQASTQVFPASAQVTAQIACALGRQVTPTTARLLARAGTDVSQSVEPAKSFFKRDRPFVGQSDPRTCDPRSLGGLGGSTGGVLSYAYPSGHAAYGELWGKILSAAVPASAASVTAWGRQLGDNRVVCRVHWPSDVAAGRKLANAVYAKLRTNRQFNADLAAARAELAAAPAPRDCKKP